MNYILKNIKHNTYFNKKINNQLYHFVCNIDEACTFKNKKEANKILIQFKNKNNFEILMVVGNEKRRKNKIKKIEKSS